MSLCSVPWGPAWTGPKQAQQLQLYSRLVRETGLNGAVEEDSESEFVLRWPIQGVLGRIFQEVHCISKEDMWKRVGDKEFDLSFTPREDCLAQPPVTLATCDHATTAP